MSEYIYAVEFTNGLTKVGRSLNPESRLRAHLATARIASDCEIKQSKVFPMGHKVKDQENELLAFCSSRFEARSREWFVGADFDAIVGFCEGLEPTGEPSAEKVEVDRGAVSKSKDILYDLMIKPVLGKYYSMGVAEAAAYQAKELQDWVIENGGESDFLLKEDGGTSRFETVIGRVILVSQLDFFDIVSRLSYRSFSPDSIAMAAEEAELAVGQALEVLYYQGFITK
jgi:hypothetical protein